MVSEYVALPLYHRRTLSHTSLWMLYIVAQSASPLRWLLAAVCAASFLFWAHPTRTTYVFDKALATLFFCVLALHSPSPLFICSVACTYIASCYWQTLAAHLLFRLVFFWWAHRSMVGPHWPVLDMLYWLHVWVLTRTPSQSPAVLWWW